MTTRQVVTVPRASWRYRVLSWFYKREERFPETSCGVRAGAFVQPIGYIAACLFLLLLGAALLLIGGVMLYIPQEGGGLNATGPAVLIGLGVMNLLFLAFTLVQPLLWWLYVMLGVITTTLVIAVKEGFPLDPVLPGRVDLIAYGIVGIVLLVALLTTKWWLPLFRRFYTAVCKPVEYL